MPEAIINPDVSNVVEAYRTATLTAANLNSAESKNTLFTITPQSDTLLTPKRLDITREAGTAYTLGSLRARRATDDDAVFFQRPGGEPVMTWPISAEEGSAPMMVIREVDNLTSGSVYHGRVLFLVPLVPILGSTSKVGMVVFPVQKAFWNVRTVAVEYITNCSIDSGTGSLKLRFIFEEYSSVPW